MAFCSNCGNELNSNDLFCPKCGTKVNSVQEKKINLSRDPFEYFIDGVKKYFSFNGRTSRKEFWFYILYVSIIYIAFCVINIVTTFTGPSGLMKDAFGSDRTIIEIIHVIIDNIVIIGLTLPTLCITVRRLHDSNKSGWFILCPVVNIVFLFFKSKDENNKYDEDNKKYIAGKILSIIWIIVLVISSVAGFLI